ncbi:hypothetical protein CPC735_058400 [Coccidioides posadasii C735 delta SOWgp]|uniref:Uncharacterized protein n=1 Tax=Coccidioides posadasii (strain C735) TaxID=222929 RepID=C5PIW7_COCP7|nr:hypothetical protein CPC735_058400 [Coccidioides posadasii C735 delta SOWgp]EER24470.1 hypothetical protein CPC735_058400 [Coccidioides posadasii C735 delta SOWgp]|eukprot:XP_003066615.1 hypothetical protein CPC735_058400 [Coccidioides posadasii C735 delta SOWgp]
MAQKFMLHLLLYSGDRELNRSPSPPRYQPFLYSFFGTYPSRGRRPPPEKVAFKRLTKILGQKTRSAKESLDNISRSPRKLWSRARQRLFPRATLQKQFYIQLARLSASSVDHVDDSMVSATSLAATDRATIASVSSADGADPPLEKKVHPAKIHTNSPILPRKPGKSILKPLRDNVFMQSELCTGQKHTAANTSLNLLMSFKDTTLKSRASTGSLYSRLRRSAMSKDPLSPARVQRTAAGILAVERNDYRPSNPGCHCLRGCICRVLERYFQNIIDENIATIAPEDMTKSQATKINVVRFDHADVYPIEAIEESDDESSLFADFQWIDELDVFDNYRDDILNLMGTRGDPEDSDESLLAS